VQIAGQSLSVSDENQKRTGSASNIWSVAAAETAHTFGCHAPAHTNGCDFHETSLVRRRRRWPRCPCRPSGRKPTNDHACVNDACTLQSLSRRAEGAGRRRRDDVAGVAALRNLGLRHLGHGPSVKPGDDFYKFANGTWDANTAIPATAPATAISTSCRNCRKPAPRRSSRTAASKTPRPVTRPRSAPPIAPSWTRPGIEKLDAKPIAVAGRCPQGQDQGRIHRPDGQEPDHAGYSAMIGVGISTDAKNPRRYAVYFSTGGLSLPDRDYYLKAKFAARRPPTRPMSPRC
jgi:putative endopeptidase